MTKRRRYDSSDEYEEFGKDIAGEENPNIILTNEEKGALKRLGMTVHMIRTLSVKDFNDFVRGKSQGDSRVAKTLRRKLKNRGYAADCRNKREERLMLLKSKKMAIEKVLEEEKMRHSNLLKHHNDLQWKCELMESLLAKGCPTILPSGQIIPKPN